MSLSYLISKKFSKNSKAGIKPKDLALQYRVDRSVISRLIKNRTHIEGAIANNSSLNRKRDRKCNGLDIDEVLFKWFTEQRAKNITIHGPVLLEKAVQFAAQLGSDFTPNASWLDRFKSRHNIGFTKIHGERSSADISAAETWLTNVLPGELSGYSPDSIYNADETAWFYKALPTGTLNERGKPVFGYKQNKDRITLLFIVNQTGTDKQLFIIGKYANPRCFRGNSPPLPYYSNKKAWMTSDVWRKIMLDFDHKMRASNKKAILFCDNAACHTSENMGLSNTRISFLPPNVTSVIQPLDQGIIHAAKSHYRSQLIREMILEIDTVGQVDEFAKGLTILKAMRMVKRALNNVTTTTITNCFRKAGFPNDILNVEVLPDNEEDLTIADTVDLPEEISCELFGEYLDVDYDLQPHGFLSETELLAEVQPNANAESSDDEASDGHIDLLVQPPSIAEGLKMIERLRSIFPNDNIAQVSLDNVQVQLEKRQAKVQVKITDFFHV